jgi:hypothetical protein
MARGFESKDVEYQQAEAARRATPHRAPAPGDRARAEARAVIALSLAHARRELAAARAPAHQHMLEQAIGDLEARLASDADA